jgi:hypothetical protein
MYLGVRHIEFQFHRTRVLSKPSGASFFRAVFWITTMTPPISPSNFKFE